jgi:hypothetical protein
MRTFFTGLILLGASIALGRPSPDLPAQGVQQADPLDLFKVTTPVYKHARCINCHGAVVASTGQGHQGGPVGTDESCTSSCHDQANNDNNTGADDWAQPTQDKWFVGKSDKELCAQMAERITRRGTEEFAHHVEADFLIDLAFVGLRGGAADPAVPDVPRMPKDDFLLATMKWLTEGHGSCARSGTINQQEVIKHEYTHRQGPMVTTLTQDVDRSVTISPSGTGFQATIVMRGSSTSNQVIHHERPTCTSVVGAIKAYDATRTVPASISTHVLPSGEYTITVRTDPELWPTRTSYTASSDCPGAAPRPADPHTEDWESQAWEFTVKGRFHNPRDRRFLAGTTVKKVEGYGPGPEVGAWLLDNLGDIGRIDGGPPIPIQVTTNWNLTYRPR